MAIFKEIPPTAGFPLRISDFFRSGNFEEGLQSYLGLDYLKVTYSGTAAFYLILEALKELSPRKKVIIPSFVCPLLPLAIKRAGLKIEVCDIKAGSFDFDLQHLEELCRYKDILAVLCVHLGGIPVDVNNTEKITRPKGIFIVEDCAQSLGASCGGKKTGTIGDFSFFSFCRGKGLTIYEGGAVASRRRDYQFILDKKIEKLTNKDYFSESIKIAELFGYWIFYRPFLFWFVYNLPQLFWELTGNPLKGASEYFDEDFPVHKVSRFRKAIGHAQLARLEKEIEERRHKAQLYFQAFEGVKGLRIIREQEGSRATYLYLTIVFDDADRRLRVFNQLRNSGLGVSYVYTYAIGGYDYLRPIVPAGDYRAGNFMADNSFTLSTSCFLKEKQILELAGKIRKT